MVSVTAVYVGPAKEGEEVLKPMREFARPYKLDIDLDVRNLATKRTMVTAKVIAGILTSIRYAGNLKPSITERTTDC